MSDLENKQRKDTLRLIAYLVLVAVTIAKVALTIYEEYPYIIDGYLEFLGELMASFWGYELPILGFDRYLLPIILFFLIIFESRNIFRDVIRKTFVFCMFAVIATIFSLMPDIYYLKLGGISYLKYGLKFYDGMLDLGLIFFVIVCATRIRKEIKESSINKQSKSSRILPNNSAATIILLSIVTLGIYYLVWAYKIISYFEPKRGKKPVVEMLLLIFIPFYVLYWLYKTAEDVYKLQKENGLDITPFNTLVVVLGIFGLGIISMAILQDNINKINLAMEEAVA